MKLSYSVCALVVGLSLAACCKEHCDDDPTPPPPPPPNPVTIERELMITDLAVVESTRATADGGAWTFGRAFRDLFAQGTDPKTALLDWLQSWEVSQNLAGTPFEAAARNSIRARVIDTWKANQGTPGVTDSAWNVNWDRAPFRLLAIVNRIDLRDRAEGDFDSAPGESRFVFGLTAPDSTPGARDGSPLQFTVIFEYRNPVRSGSQMLEWARMWNALELSPLGSEAYLSQLQQLTTLFSTRQSGPNGLRGRGLSQLRTNEIALASPWELREFRLSSDERRLVTSHTRLTPDDSLNNSTALQTFVQNHSAEVATQSHFFDVIEAGQPFGAIAPQVPGPGFRWQIPGVAEQLRANFSFLTCSACHAGETGTFFTHVSPRPKGSASTMSRFLRAAPGTPRLPVLADFDDDLSRRQEDMRQLLTHVVEEGVLRPSIMEAPGRDARPTRARVH